MNTAWSLINELKRTVALIVRPRASLDRLTRIRIKRVLRNCADGAVCLEIGGPSKLLSCGDELPVYPYIASLDLVNFSGRTVWASDEAAVDVKKRNSYILDATDLREIPDETYDLVVACHCLEHVANPIRAVLEWRRVLRAGGSLVVIVPNKAATFDRRRKVTPPSHLIEDFERDIGEDDLTHLDEIMELHDFARDPGAGSRESFEARSLNNIENRCLHHHVFSLSTLRGVLKESRIDVKGVAKIGPIHLLAWGSRSPGKAV